jgi:3'-5' exoribonuclease
VKSIFVTDLTANVELVNEPFLLHEVTRRKTRDGRPFLLGALRDKTGKVGCVFWDVPDYVEAWARSGQVVLASGRTTIYKDALQIILTDLNPSQNANMADFLPTSGRKQAEMLDELSRHVAQLNEPWRTLTGAILLEEPVISRFAVAPAARGMHHAYIGGLLEHSLSMATLAAALAAHYPYVNKDLLIAGALLHDVGKTLEYTLDGSFDYTEDGRLVGHIVRAIVMVEQTAAALNFPESELRQLVHLIASHHGTHEWGAPVIPKTLEAILLHQLDLLDSRVQGFFDHLDSDNSADDWTIRSSGMFGTELRRPDRYGGEDE